MYRSADVFGDLGDREPVEVVQDQHAAMGRRQARQRCQRPLSGVGAGEQLLVLDPVGLGLVPTLPRPLLPNGTAHVVDVLVAGDAEQPRHGQRDVRTDAQLAGGGQEGLLQEVVGDEPVAASTEQIAMDARHGVAEELDPSIVREPPFSHHAVDRPTIADPSRDVKFLASMSPVVAGPDVDAYPVGVRRRRVDRGQVLWAATLVLAAVEAALVETNHGQVAVRLLAVGLAAGGILLRRRSTIWCGAGAGVGTVIGVAGGADSLGLFVLSAAAVGWCGYAGRSPFASLGASALVVIPAIGATWTTVEAAELASSMTWTAVLFGVAWSVGVGIERLRAQAVKAEDLAARTSADASARVTAALAEERRRIAADLHDVLAHSLTAVAVQAGATSRIIDVDPEAARAALLAIQRVGADAVDELRRLFDVLDAGSAAGVDTGARTSQPALTDINSLCDDARAMGLEVRLTSEGDLGDVAPGPAAAMYRIVQESLTNSRRHGGRCSVDVQVVRRPTAIVADVVTHLVGGDVEPSTSGTGRGLLGMRERVTIYGGSLDAGPSAAGWTIHAEIPVGMPALSARS